VKDDNTSPEHNNTTDTNTTDTTDDNTIDAADNYNNNTSATTTTTNNNNNNNNTTKHNNPLTEEKVAVDPFTSPIRSSHTYRSKHSSEKRSNNNNNNNNSNNNNNNNNNNNGSGKKLPLTARSEGDSVFLDRYANPERVMRYRLKGGNNLKQYIAETSVAGHLDPRLGSVGFSQGRSFHREDGGLTSPVTLRPSSSNHLSSPLLPSLAHTPKPPQHESNPFTSATPNTGSNSKSARKRPPQPSERAKQQYLNSPLWPSDNEVTFQSQTLYSAAGRSYA
jgi:hypothetical protein